MIGWSVEKFQNREPSASKKAEGLHKKALEVVSRYKRSEIDLIEVIEEVDRYKVFYSLGYNSLFKYATDGLGLSEEVAYIFINVARKTRQVPALKEEIRAGAITVSKAKKITSVINETNQGAWIEIAKTSTKRELEKRVAAASPATTIREKMEFVAVPLEKVKIISLPPIETKGVSNPLIDAKNRSHEVMAQKKVRVQLQVGVSEELMLAIRRVQDLVSQRKRRSASLEESLWTMTELFLEKEDPVRKAKRQKTRGKVQSEMGEQVPGPVDRNKIEGHGQPEAQGKAGRRRNPRPPIKSSLRHQVMLKFHGQCGHVDPGGRRCGQKRFLDIHHIQPVSQGGRNCLENLELLCSGHHRVRHWQNRDANSS